MITEQQLENRVHSIGGSDSPVVLGVSDWKTPYELWLEKTKRVPVTQLQTPDIQRGNALEPLAAQKYRQDTNRKLKVYDSTIRHPTVDFMTANIDRVIDSAVEGQKGKGILEIKCPSLGAFCKIKREGAPPAAMVQVNHYMSCLDMEWASLAFFCADRWELLTFDVTRDNKLIDLILEKNTEFWGWVKSDTPPPAPTEEMQINMPDIAGANIIDLSVELLALIDDYQAIAEAVKEAEATKQHIQGKIAKVFDSQQATIGENEDFRVYCRSQAGRKTFQKDVCLRDLRSALSAIHDAIAIIKAWYAEGKHLDSWEDYYLSAPDMQRIRELAEIIFDDETYLKTGKPSQYFRIFNKKGR